MVEMNVAGIALDAASRSPIVLLRDPAGQLQIPIWIDQAQNILAGLSQEPPPRPLSDDLMASLLAAGGLNVGRVIIHTIEDITFRSVLKVMDEQNESADTDARPSDATALALRTGAGIWMLEEVVADASIPLGAGADAQDSAGFRQFLGRVSPIDLARSLSRARTKAGPTGSEQENQDPGDPHSNGDSEAEPGEDEE